jgi:SAM-dependent methyltransferase
MHEDELSLVRVEDGKCFYDKKIIDRLSPDRIDSRKFWKVATTLFPFFSVCGNDNRGIKNTDDVNAATIAMSRDLGCLKAVYELIQYKHSAHILEIGGGYGNFLNFIKQYHNDDNYYAIDVNPLFSHPRHYMTNGHSIPKLVPRGLDLVYSVNVFQHLTSRQRTLYYKSIYRKLKNGGSFIFGMFVVTPQNKNWDTWQSRDENGRCYVNFFKQLTPVDTLEELYTELGDIGFIVEHLSPIEDKCHYLTFKCTKHERD